MVTVKSLASGDATPNEGDTVTFEITVNNSGPDAATNISLTDFLPQGLTATANNGDVVGGGSYDPATGVLSIATLASGGTVTLTLEGVVDPGQGGNVITNTTTAATGDQVDPSTVGDDLEEAVTVGVQTADLVTVKSLASGDATPDEGDIVTFEIAVTNSGPNSATNISLTDFLPQGLTATIDNGNVVGGGLYNPATGVLSIATLASGDTVTLTLEGTVNPGQGGSVITNTTTAATGDQVDPSTVGDDLEEAVTVGVPAADLVTVKTLASNDATPDEGDVVTFEIAVTNSGPDAATNISLTDFLPQGLTATVNNGSVDGGGIYDPTTGVLSIATLASGDTVTLTLEGIVDPGQGGNVITNTTTAATGDQVDPSTVGDDLEEAVTVVVPTADLITIKTLASGDARPDVGDIVTFEIAVNNSGPNLATNVSLTDFLPQGLTATTNNGNVDGGGLYDPATGVLSIAMLASGDTVTLTLEGTVNPGQSGSVITNTTTAATGDQVDPSTVGDDLEETVAVGILAADLVTVKTLASGDATPNEGDVVTFEINVTNNGAATATGVFLTDFLPAGLTATEDNGTVTQGSYDPTSGIFGIGTIATGDTVTLTLQGTVNPGEGGNTISNITTAAMGDQVDSSTVGDDLEESVTVVAPLLGSIGNLVFEDLNANGIRDAGDPGEPGVTIELLDGNGNAILDGAGNPITTVTDANGFYEFTDLAAGDYRVRSSLPPAHFFTAQDAGNDDTIDSDVDSTGLSSVVTLGEGENNPTVDVGIAHFADLGGSVSFDDNGDGIQDTGEAGVANVVVNLFDGNGNPVLDDEGCSLFPPTTDANGRLHVC